jgi:predicted Zn finger-like uncharacterized protein
MSWITRCPACGVTYTVVPDQLKVAQGWLRCGQCQQAFDSTGLVLCWAFEPRNAETPWPPESAADRLVIDDLLTQEDRSTTETPVTAVDAFEEALSTFKPVPLLPSAQSGVFCVPLDALLEQDASTTAESPQALPAGRSWWPVALVVGLFLALALQWLWAGRHLLAGTVPVLAEPAQQVCRYLGCEIGPLLIRDGVVIDSSSLTPRDGGFELLWSVRNVTAQALQMPALELTWFDAQDKAHVRRVFLLAEQGAPSALAAGQIWSGQLQLMPAEGLQAGGYRLVSFYP